LALLGEFERQNEGWQRGPLPSFGRSQAKVGNSKALFGLADWTRKPKGGKTLTTHGLGPKILGKSSFSLLF
jgi:hypothetical protein